MKLAEALNERKALQDRMERLQQRLFANVKVQEGDSPSEEPDALFVELDKTVEALESLVTRINRTNLQTMLDGRALAELVTERDLGIKHVNILKQVLMVAAERTDRRTKTEIRIVTTVDVANRQKALDKKAKEIRELDAKIQALNWTTDLL